MVLMRPEVPWALQRVLDSLKYDENWEFKVRHVGHGFVNPRFVFLIWIKVRDSFPPHQTIQLEHSFSLPSAPLDEDEWAKWVLEKIFLVNNHEAMEKFEINGVKMFVPDHDLLKDPYRLKQKVTFKETKDDNEYCNGNQYSRSGVD